MFPVLYKLHPQSPSSFRRRARNKLVSTDNRQPSATLVGALWSPQASFPPAPRELRDPREAEACVSTVSAAGPPCLQGAWRARPGALTLPVCPLQPELRGQTPPAPAQLPCPPDPGFEEQSRSASCKQGAPPISLENGEPPISVVPLGRLLVFLLQEAGRREGLGCAHIHHMFCPS